MVCRCNRSLSTQQFIFVSCVFNRKSDKSQFTALLTVANSKNPNIIISHLMNVFYTRYFGQQQNIAASTCEWCIKPLPLVIILHENFFSSYNVTSWPVIYMSKSHFSGNVPHHFAFSIRYSLTLVILIFFF